LRDNSILQNDGILSAVMIGDRSTIDNNTMLTFSRTGMRHILTVSGLHLMLLSAAAYGALKKLRVPLQLSSIICIAFILIFMAMVGFSPPILRAGIMAIIMYGGKLFYKNSDSLNSLGIAAVFILLLNPFSVRSISFTFSFAATLGILILYPRLKTWITLKFRIKNKIIKSVLDVFLVSFSANIFLLPFTILFFDEITIISPITNMLLFPFISFALYFGYLAFLFSPISFIASALLFLAESSLELIIFVCNIIERIPFIYFPTGYSFILIWLVASLALILFCTFFKNRYKLYQVAAAISFVALVIGVFSYTISTHGAISITFFQSSPNNVVVRYGNRGSVFGESGSLFPSLQYLRQKGVQNLDALVLTSFGRNGMRDLNRFLERENTSSVFLPLRYYQGTKNHILHITGIEPKIIEENNFVLGGEIDVEFDKDPLNDDISYRFSFDDFAVIVYQNSENPTSFAKQNRVNIISFSNNHFDENLNILYTLGSGENYELLLREFFDGSGYERIILTLRKGGRIRIRGENDLVF